MRQIKNSKINPESLLQIPLMRQALNDKSFSVVRRAISKVWTYEKYIPMSMGGFNPLLSAAFVAGVSRISEWLKKPEASARPLNLDDRLVLEALFLVHDYLHSWGYRAINEVMPRLGFGTKPIDESNFEDFVFCHLLTETIAVIGLDYWYLSTLRLNDICQIGTGVENLTVTYHERWSPECLRFNKRHAIQEPQFFERLAKFYCTGFFYGYDMDAFANSSFIEHWLEHEISYGDTQRVYTRQWLHFFRSKNFELNPARLGSQVKVSKKWQKNLMTGISELLWEKVKSDKAHDLSFRFKKDHIWQPYPSDQVDMRFQNINRMDPEKCYNKIMKGPNLKENFRYFFYQYVSQFDYATFDSEVIKLFPHLIEKQDFKLISHLFKGAQKVKGFDVEPRDLFFLN